MVSTWGVQPLQDLVGSTFVAMDIVLWVPDSGSFEISMPGYLNSSMILKTRATYYLSNAT